MLFNRKPKQDHIKHVLSGVMSPIGDGDLLSAGYVQAMSLEAGKVTIILDMHDPKHAPAFEVVRVELEQALLAADRVKEACVILTAERQSGAAQVQNTSSPTKAPPEANDSAPREEEGLHFDVRHIIAVASGKGGVGKSTVAANLAAAMRRKGLRVGLLDADIYGPSQPIMFGVQDKSAAFEGAKIAPITSEDGIQLMSSGFLVGGRAPLVWRGPMVHKALGQMVRDVDWGFNADEGHEGAQGRKSLDVLILDMPPGTGDVYLTLAKAVDFTGAVIVTTPQDIALADAVKGIEMFKKLDIPILGIAENMAQFCCPNCGHVSEIFGQGGAARESDASGVDVLGKLSLFPETRECADKGKPIVFAEPHHDATSEYLALADRVLGCVEA